MYLNYWFKHFTVTVQKVQEFATVKSKINVCILEISPTPNQILGDPLRHLSYFNFTTIFFFFASTCVISPKKFIFYYFYICMSSFVTHKFLFTFQVQVWLYSSSICKLNVRVKPVLRGHLWDKEKMVF